MKISKVNLKKIEVLEQDGEYSTVIAEEKNVPCMITNHALKRGKDLGLIKTSLIAGLMKLQGLEKFKTKNGVDPRALDSIDEVELQSVIYIGILGANRNIELSFEEFLEQFHYSFDETVTLYTNILSNYMPNDNQFAKGLAASTKSGKKGNR
ncbi:hypothetical protein IHV10_22340 [Fictibacillus sp. 5RED26]|uniref:hypothetical protein n=1 Tax=Fictibacillus sp. 5RED26 TaxID=2745876 RepID=UPI0018CDD63F|nr:hypothetical protein [Fictibacillus sp. 5RED26]MBH0159113.1 hypothetical protein [Fictibacillus sp. 5RED26]